AGSRAKASARQDGGGPAGVNDAAASLNLKDFGAAGDGVTDDGPALQAALDALAAAGGGTLFVPEGRYAVLTPVAKSFAGTGASVTIQGVPSGTTVAPPDASATELARGLNLKSEFLPRTGAGAMLVLVGLRAAAFKDLAFVGTPGVVADAAYTFVLFDIDDASVEHCEFYGLSSSIHGSDVAAVRSRLRIRQSVFLGCTANSGAYTSVVQNVEWKGFSLEESVFLDYGLRPELFSKTGLSAPFSWVDLGNAAALTNDSPRREAVFRSVFMDEGGIIGIASFPTRYSSTSPPADLVYVTGLRMNVSNLVSAGHYLTGVRSVLVESSAYGWSKHADSAINLGGVGHGILDRVHTEASATRLRADAATARLTVIDSEYTDLASLAQQTVVVKTQQPGEDPVQYVRGRFQSALARAPDAAAHFYWSDKILRCGADSACAASARAALDAYLAASPAETFRVTGKATDEFDAPLAGATVALTGSQTATTTTDAAGLYHFSKLPTSGVYAVTASKTNYAFAAPTKTLATPAADVTADFAAALKRFTISGRATDGAGVAVRGVTLALTGSQAAAATTDSNGNYSFTGVVAGGSYAVKPALLGYVFTPASAGIANLSADARADFRGVFVEYRITGRVTKSDNTPVPGVAVSLSGSKSAAATTDANGDYSFNAPSGGDYAVTPSKTDHTFGPASRAFTALGSDQAGNFTATPGTHAIRGRVTGAGGGALAGATLTLSGSKSATATSDANGDYSFALLPSDGTYTVIAAKANYAFTPPGQTFAQPTTDKTANFSGALVNYTLSGRVTEGTAGLSGVTVSLTGSQTATATTGADGSYSFNVKAEGDYTVTPARAHYGFAPQSRVFANLDGDKAANFAATRIRHDIAGRVTKPDGSALAGVAVALSGSQTSTATTDAQGNYSFAGLAGGGDYAVRPALRHYTFAPASKEFKDLGANQTADFAAALDTHAVSGRVTKPDGSGLAGATIALTGPRAATATTDAQGDYSFAGLDAGGNYTVTASKTNYSFAPPSRSFTDLSSDHAADFAGALVSYRITGRVSDGGSGLGGVSVALAGSQTAATTTAADGSYSFTVKAEGDYTLTASKVHYSFAPQSQTLNNLSGDRTADFAATLLRHDIAGRVTKADGSGLAGATVSLTGSKSATATTDAGGNYSFTNLDGGGGYTLTASKTNYAVTPASRAFTDLSANQTADFAAALVNYTLSGRVTDEGGGGLVGVAVSLTGSRTASATTAADGSYSFTVPAEGGYTVTPAKAHYSFAPQGRVFANLGGDEAADFAATLLRFAVRGRVADINNTGMQGITVSLTGSQTATTTTAADGSYSFASLASGGTYTVTPSFPNFAFTPASKTIEGLDADAFAGFTGGLARFRITGRVTEKGAGVAGVAVDLAGSHPLAGPDARRVLTGADGSYSFDVTSGGTYVVTPSWVNHTFSPASLRFDSVDGDRAADFDAARVKSVEFGAASLSVGEGGGTLEVTVTRGGDTSGEGSAVYEVKSGTALRGADVVGSTGRVTFAPGETTKTFTIFITDDAIVEGPESFSVSLMPEGELVVGDRPTLAVTISDNDKDPAAANPLDEAGFFVRQHYRDFLGRDPDAPGLAFWTDQIRRCGADAPCAEAARINVSAAFFLAIEFQQSGFFAYKAYRAAYGRTPERLKEFTLDAREISAGVVVGETGWESKLETRKRTYVSEFVARPEFERHYPLALTPAQFVAALDANAGDSLTAAESEAAAAEFAGAANTEDLEARARVLRAVIDNGAFHKRETNPAFVLMEYFGYLRREPDDPPNTNLDGYNFWLKKLDDNGGDFKRAEMVKAFLSSEEYRKRFGN
ncbi:MAG TPA: carboxypeptidase regulatory-like domain-containing protein, partial [Pyrinomonadaceae bacterium]|nr:carboxypeptidase regulatory-like domain-containing protein [Pyrinomonadaceae bacterium]